MSCNMSQIFREEDVEREGNMVFSCEEDFEMKSVEIDGWLSA